MQKVLKALLNARPPQPRYIVQWDVDQLLQYIWSLGISKALSDKDISFKVALLIALTSACRSSELNVFDLRYLMDHVESIAFTLSKLTESRKYGSPALLVTFHMFEDDPILCVVQAIMDNQERSKPWRRNDICKNQFLLSYVEPHKPAVS